MPSLSGEMMPGVFLEPFAGSTQDIVEAEGVLPDASPEAILAALQAGGFVGLGGAAFPTHA